MPLSVSSLTAARAFGAAFGVAGGLGMTTIIMTTTTRLRGASG